MSSAPDATLDIPHFVYRCYSGDNTLLYIGVARDVEARIYHHLHECNRNKVPNGPLRRHMERYEATRFPTKLAARAEERRAIAAESPLLNRQHNPQRFRKVGTATYGLVAPVHPIVAEVFAGCPVIEQERAA